MFIIYDHILRYDPSSAEWVAVLTEQKANAKTVTASKRKADGPKNKKTSAKKQKTSNKENNSDLIV